MELLEVPLMNKNKPILWNRNFIQCFISYFFLNFSYQMLLPIIPLYIIETLGIESGFAGVVLASYTAGVLLVRPFSGYLVDIFSRKKLYTIAFFIFAFMFMGYWVAVVPIIIMVVRFIQGIFMGIASVASNTIAIDVIPSERRGEGMGFYGVAINIAMALAQVVAVFTYNLYGFNILIGVALTLALVGGYSVTRINYTSKPPEKSNNVLSLDRFILVKALPASLSFILLEAPYGMLISFAVIFGKEIGVDEPSYFFICMAVGILTSRIIAGKLVDRGQIHSITITSTTLLIIAFTIFSFASSSLYFYSCGLLLGLSYGICIPAYQTLFINVAPPSRRGTATSTYLSSFDLGSGMGMIIAGVIAQHISLSVAYQTGAFMLFCSLIYYITKVIKSYETNLIREQEKI